MSDLDRDWHVADIRAAIAKTDINFEQLAKENGIAGATLRNALRFKYPKAERIIAERIGVSPEEIWPSRYINKCA
ncbi:helix-turn-helix domain-containing protein [Aliivibrio fischeri]